MKYIKGISLFEILVTIGIVGILAGLSIPSFVDFLAKKRLAAAATALHSELNQARAWSIKSNSTVFLTFNNGNNWCYGVSDSNNQCDCSTNNGCQVNGLNHMSGGTIYRGISMSTTVSTVTTTTGAVYNQIDPRRGMPQNSTTITLTNTNNDTVVIGMRATGRVSVCSNNLNQFPDCA